MHRICRYGLLPLLLSACAAGADDLEQLMTRAELHASVRERTEGALLKESTAAEQAATEARHDGGYSFELRPGFTEDAAQIALRISLPNQWSKNKLREQLALVAESEQLRVAALEWQQLLEVYRDFCSYRMCRKQSALYAAELETLEPSLAQADRSVSQNQLAVADRAKLYSLYLDLLNDREKVEMDLLGLRRNLHLVLGSHADLDLFADVAAIDLPTRPELAALIQRALENRADYRRLDIQARALGMAEAAAQSQDGFHLKHIQPEYSMDYDGSGKTWGISASFALPWGTRNPDTAVYRQQRMLAVSAMEQQRRMVAERMAVLLDMSDAYAEQKARQSRLAQPLIAQLEADLGTMDRLPFDRLRDRIAIRERLLDNALQSARADCDREMLAVDLAEEIGTLGE